MSSISPDELVAVVEACIRGDLSAQTRLYELYKDMVYGYLLRLLGNRHDADDAFQNTWVIAFTKLHQLRDRSAVKSWIMQIAHSHACHLRPHRTSHRHSFTIDSASELVDTSTPAPDEKLIHAEQDEKLDQALQRISNEHRAVVLLFYHERLQYAEISSILGIPIGTVKSRLNRAMHELTSILRSYRKF
jgi:RNA polymerase sigma-70 factor (ECF subfamily)